MQLFARIAIFKKRQRKDLKRLLLFSLKNYYRNPPGIFYSLCSFLRVLPFSRKGNEKI
jgi:hypothetical protein